MKSDSKKSTWLGKTPHARSTPNCQIHKHSPFSVFDVQARKQKKFTTQQPFQFNIKTNPKKKNSNFKLFQYANELAPQFDI